MLFREDNSGLSQGGHSFRLLSSAYSFGGNQTPRDVSEDGENAKVAAKSNKAQKSFFAYILGSDEQISLGQ